jgi:hypothetical protein
VREISFKIVADSGEVVVDRLWIDVVTHEDGEETQSFGCWVNGAVMEMTESEI